METIKKQDKSLGTLLLQAEYITKEQLDEALREQASTGEHLGKILVKNGIIKEQQIMEMLKGILVVVFQVREELYALEVVFSKEIIKPKKIIPVPGVPSYILGLMGIREDVVPVISLSMKIFGKQSPIDENSRVIIVEVKEEKIGLLADGVYSVRNFEASDFENASKHNFDSDKKYIAGIIRDKDRIVTLLKPEAFAEKDNKP
ncbi:MAG: chemotaxis protein CheW [Candidatus Goldbacteria bacterium]|nr:chemotaxis protein CheW [Candidatus Goldiibacteriota bacterium]